jgi:hypothetical protein
MKQLSHIEEPQVTWGSIDVGCIVRLTHPEARHSKEPGQNDLLSVLGVN